ncbi:hypothetical protein ASZ90_007835 [hydrocarbon metagenome]|uniref:Uncharacterized protein n=1 Tax=hydrocarbon metagenome TaxID=938273 RepID=A0A0W8FND4_9ZZZZ
MPLITLPVPKLAIGIVTPLIVTLSTSPNPSGSDIVKLPDA